MKKKILSLCGLGIREAVRYGGPDEAATVLQTYISNYTGKMDKYEQRPSNYGGLDLFKKQTADPLSILSPEVNANLEKSFNVGVSVPVVNYKDVSIGSARTCAMQTEGLTSALVSLTAVTYVFGFASYPMQHFENYFGYQQNISRNMEAGMQKLAATIDSASIALLEAYKNQYYPASVTAYYAQSGNAFQVPQAVKGDVYNNVNSIMSTMDYAKNLDILANPNQMALVRKFSNQGAGNSTNYSYQFAGYNWFESNRLANNALVESTFYAVAPGSVAISSRIDPSSRVRERVHESKFWDVLPNAPYIGMDLGLFYNADCGDISALQSLGLTGSTNVKVESWQFSVDVFYIRPYNSAIASRFQPINKFEILA